MTGPEFDGLDELAAGFDPAAQPEDHWTLTRVDELTGQFSRRAEAAWREQYGPFHPPSHRIEITAEFCQCPACKRERCET